MWRPQDAYHVVLNVLCVYYVCIMPGTRASEGGKGMERGKEARALCIMSYYVVSVTYQQVWVVWVVWVVGP